MIGSGKKCDECLQCLIGFLCCEDAFVPFMERPGMDPSECFPAGQIFQCNGQIFRLRLDMLSNAHP